jgi:hypothetical protein
MIIDIILSSPLERGAQDSAVAGVCLNKAIGMTHKHTPAITLKAHAPPLKRGSEHARLCLQLKKEYKTN